MAAPLRLGACLPSPRRLCAALLHWRPSAIALCFATTLCLATALGWTSCGYSSGMRLPEHYHSVGVEIFGNDTPEVNIERRLHEQMTDQVVQLLRSPVERPSRADVVLEGRLLEYSRRGGIRSGLTNSLLESAVVIRAEAWLIDRRSGERVGERAVAGVRIGYVIDEMDGERRARDRGLFDVSQRLVLDLFSSLD